MTLQGKLAVCGLMIKDINGIWSSLGRVTDFPVDNMADFVAVKVVPRELPRTIKGTISFVIYDEFYRFIKMLNKSPVKSPFQLPDNKGRKGRNRRVY